MVALEAGAEVLHSAPSTGKKPFSKREGELRGEAHLVMNANVLAWVSDCFLATGAVATISLLFRSMLDKRLSSESRAALAIVAIGALVIGLGLRGCV